MSRGRVWNLGLSFFPSKVPPDTPYLSPWWTNFSEICYTFDLTQVMKNIKKISTRIHQEQIYGVSDGTFEDKKDQPKS